MMNNDFIKIRLRTYALIRVASSPAVPTTFARLLGKNHILEKTNIVKIQRSEKTTFDLKAGDAIRTFNVVQCNN